MDRDSEAVELRWVPGTFHPRAFPWPAPAPLGLRYRGPVGLAAVGPGNPVYRRHDGDAYGRNSRRISVRGDGEELVAAPGWRSPGQDPVLLAAPSRAMPFTYTTDLSEVRARVRSHARQAGLPEARANDLVLAVSEVAANTLRHARSAGTLTIWHDDSEIVCEIRDSGIITDPLAGQRRPPADALAGHGLWLVHQLCDQVELTSGDGGTTIRMRMAILAHGAGD